MLDSRAGPKIGGAARSIRVVAVATSVVIASTLTWLPGSLLAQEAALPPAAPASGLPNVPGIGQIKSLFERLGKPSAGGTPTTVAPAAVAPPSADTQRAGGSLNVKTEIALEPNKAALNDLAVDRSCVKPQERYDVFEKAAEYGGTNAQLRLRRLLETDFQHSELTDSDRRMLKYLAYTTIWIPAPLESAVGKAWLAFASAGDEQQVGRSGRTQRRAVERIEERLAVIRSTISDFPGDAKLLLDPELRDGAFARVGGLVVISPRFLSLMDETDPVRDVVLAHELSHLYKRHTVKELQYRLISSSAGFQLFKKLLAKPEGSTVPGLSVITGMVSNFTLAKELFELLRSSQLSYSREQELEADACALHWLERQDTDARTAWQVFAGILSFSGARADGEASYENLHPSPAERTSNIEQALGKRAAGGAAPQQAKLPKKK